MPIYEFRCARCSKQYEELVGVGSGSDSRCPHCGHDKRTRVPSRFAIASVPVENGDGAAASGSCCGGNSAACGCR